MNIEDNVPNTTPIDIANANGWILLPPSNKITINTIKAVDEVLNEGTTLTPDLHGTATTEAYCDAIIAKL